MFSAGDDFRHVPTKFWTFRPRNGSAPAPQDTGEMNVLVGYAADTAIKVFCDSDEIGKALSGLSARERAVYIEGMTAVWSRVAEFGRLSMMIEDDMSLSERVREAADEDEFYRMCRDETFLTGSEFRLISSALGVFRDFDDE